MTPDYPENATSLERLEWYRDHDIEKGWILCHVLESLEENFSIGIEWMGTD